MVRYQGVGKQKPQTHCLFLIFIIDIDSFVHDPNYYLSKGADQKREAPNISFVASEIHVLLKQLTFEREARRTNDAKYMQNLLAI